MAKFLGPNLDAKAMTLVTDLAVAEGGTAGHAAPTLGGVAYGTGSAYGVTAAGTSGQVLTSNGAAAPTWGGSSAVDLGDGTIDLTTAFSTTDLGDGTIDLTV